MSLADTASNLILVVLNTIPGSDKYGKSDAQLIDPVNVWRNPAPPRRPHPTLLIKLCV